MVSLINKISAEPVFAELLGALEAGKLPAVLGGLGHIHRALTAAAVYARTGRPVFAVCADEGEAERMAGDLFTLTGVSPLRLYSREFRFFEVEAGSMHYERRRLATLSSLALYEGSSPPLVVATADGLIQRAAPPDKLRNSSFVLRSGQEAQPSAIADKLAQMGYARVDTVENRGEFAVRGGIVDIFSPALGSPVRVEFFGDEIDLMGLFDTGTQRRTEDVGEALITPAAEMEAGANDTKFSEYYPEFFCGADYIPFDAAIVIMEPGRVRQRADNYVWQLREDIKSLLESGRIDKKNTEFFLDPELLFSRLGDYPVIMADSFISGEYPLRPRTLLSLTAKQLPGYGGSLETARSDISRYLEEGFEVCVLAGDEERAEKLRDILPAGESLPREAPASRRVRQNAAANPEEAAASRLRIIIGSLSAGFELPSIRLAAISEGQLMPAPRRRTVRQKKDSGRKRISSYMELTPGDLVVHDLHGIGRFVEVTRLVVDGVEKDYMKIQYAGTDSLYVPALQLDMVSKYIGGGEDSAVRLNKLGGVEWTRTKSRAKAAARDLARELIALYAERQKIEGIAFSPDSVWQAEFEDSFEYIETDDQLRCASEIKADMEKPVPMDRLLCGDVGYGKTEVAFRAIMKCILEGYQAAILAPTTVLAQQHYVTASRRFAGMPVRIEVLSRFRSSAQIKKSISALASGECDIVIGTHRLLQKDIVFKKLGLVVVDEEQRFGVSHKEHLKEMTKNVDVLTLTATPIPRTLNMALSGIRDMSIIEEPPSDRYPVQTYVLEYNSSVILDAIRRECARGGQVYYLHNRVESIEKRAAALRRELPGLTVAVAHGKQSEEELSEVMRRMTEGEVQVLVCTTIIETGIDIPNVNTLIIEDADRLGLAQLHQIRGRVGRSSRRAYAYFTYRRGKVLTEVAAKRLSAIREFAEFGSGFKIAMRDLEIRGAGNILGAEQSGNMMSVGYDMYLRLLEDAVAEERGEEPPQEISECLADLPVPASIPETYVHSGKQRMDLYRRIAAIRTEEDLDDLMDEIIDRFGEPPREVNSLCTVALLRAKAARAGVKEILSKDGRLVLRLSRVDIERVSSVCARPEYSKRVLFDAGSDPSLSLKLRKGDDVLKEAKAFIGHFTKRPDTPGGSNMQ
ncbi:MAG: transcription-repair coupling factor [Oscillospiraceae bacterium]|jgi:transcription-repair coupling factor (superfamily II helicase)